MTTGPAPVSSIDDLLAHREWIKRLALRLARDEHAADDLVQDAWLAALRHPPRQGGARAWLRKVVRHRAHNVHRDEMRRDARALRRGPPPLVRSTVESVAEADAHRHVVDAVMDIDEPYRSTLVLRYFEQLSVEEVARRTDVPLETARARLRRGRDRLRKRLDGEFGSRAAWCVPLLDGWPGLGGGKVRASVAGAVAATFLGGLIVNKILIGGAAVIALVVAGLLLAESDEPVGPAPVEEQPVEVADGGRSGERQHVTVESTSETGPDAAAVTDAAAVEEDPVAAFRRMMDALPHRKITGVVRDIEGRPLAGALVIGGSESGPNGSPHATAIADAAADGESAASPGATGQPAETIESVVAARYRVQTKADGTFELELPIRDETPAPNGDIYVWAYAEHHAGSGAPVPDDVDHVELRLSRAVTLRVRLLDAKGTPIAGRSIRVDAEFSGGRGNTRTTPTDAAGWAVAPGLPAGGLVTVRTKSTARLSDLREAVQLPDHGEAEVVLRDDGVRRVRITAIVSDPAIRVSGLFVESRNGGSEIRAWPGGREAVVELPDRGVQIGLSSAVGPGEIVALPDDADEIELRLSVPAHRWLEVVIGDRDPTNMSFTGMAGGQLAIGNLTDMVSDGVLRLPIVDGGEYALREIVGNRYRLIGSVGPKRIDLDAPQHVVSVRVTQAGGGALPPGTNVTATPGARGVRQARASVEGVVTANGDIPLALVPGITYALVVQAPGMASVRVEHRPVADGGEVALTLQAGEPLRIAIEGIASGSRTSVITFPDFGRVESTVDSGSVVVEGVRDGWVLVMAASRVVLVNASGAAPRNVPAGAAFAPDPQIGDASGRRMFLVGTEPLSDGVYPIGLVGAPFGSPEGRYVPVEWTRDEIIVHAPVHLSAAAPTWTCPADDDVEWTRGEHDGSPAHVVIAADGTQLPVGALGEGHVSKWRTAGPEVTVVEVGSD